MKVLAIGNSFSQDANAYLKGVCQASGNSIRNVNLYIGGCSLYRHFQNIRADKVDYAYEFCGVTTGLNVTIKQVLLSDEWDVVTLQQASHFSHNFETYEPYLTELANYVHYYCPKARLAIHQTWSYENGSEKLANSGYAKHEDMFRDVEKAYDKAAKSIGAELIIPSGKTFENLFSLGVEKVHRDTFHASLGVGRYALSLTWMKALFGTDPVGNTFRDFSVPMSEEEIDLAQKAAAK